MHPQLRVLQAEADGPMTRRQFGALVALAAVSLAVAAVACGGGGSDAYGESDPVAVNASSVTVEMRDNSFQPKGIQIKPGTTVTWVNKDSTVHNVRQVESKFLSPDVVQPGEIFTFKFDQAGKYRYQCTNHHPTMNGVVIVGT